MTDIVAGRRYRITEHIDRPDTKYTRILEGVARDPGPTGVYIGSEVAYTCDVPGIKVTVEPLHSELHDALLEATRTAPPRHFRALERVWELIPDELL